MYEAYSFEAIIHPWNGFLSPSWENQACPLSMYKYHWGFWWCSVAQSFWSLWSHGLQHTSFPVHYQLPELVQTHVHWVNGHPIISFSAVPSSSCLHYFPASGSFPMSHLFTSGGQSIGDSASASVLPMNIQDWFPLGWTGWISLQSKGLSRVFSNTIVQKH